MSTHIIEVGPHAVRELCCGGELVDDDEMLRAAFDSIDDPVTLVELRPVALDSLWRTLLSSVNCDSPERAIVVHPSWWAAARVDVIRAAAQVLADEVVLRPRSWLLAQATAQESQHTTVIIEIADCFVVIKGPTVAAENRRGQPECVVAAVVDSILRMTSGVTAAVVIDTPSTVAGADALAVMITDGLRNVSRISAVQVGATQLKNLAAEAIRRETSTRHYTDVPAHGRRRRRGPILLAILVVALAAAVLTLGRHAAPVDHAIATIYLVEGHVALQVPAQWPIQRIVAGPGSARVQATSPSDPEVALHVTQSRVAVATLRATAESLKEAIDAEPTGVFVDFNPVGSSAGRPAVTYREIRSGHDIRWTVLVDKAVRISIGCQSRHGDEDAVRQACDVAVRSARAVG